MQPDSFSQNAAFNVSSFADKFIGTVCMRDRFDILMNYRAFIQVSCDVVRRGADHFHTAKVTGHHKVRTRGAFIGSASSLCNDEDQSSATFLVAIDYPDRLGRLPCQTACIVGRFRACQRDTHSPV